MKAFTKGLTGLAAVLVFVAVTASAARADHWRWSVTFVRPTATCVPSPLPWRTGHVPVSPVRQAYWAGYDDGYAHGFHDGVAAPVRRTVGHCGPVQSYRVIRRGSAWVRHGPAGGAVLTIRW